MSFTCPLCREEWLVINKLCPRCDRIRHIISCYSREKVIEALEKIFLVERFRENETEPDQNEYKKVGGCWVKKTLNEKTPNQEAQN